MMPDLFSFAAAAAPPPRPPAASPPTLPIPNVPEGGIAWERLLARLDPQDVTLHVSALWTGVVLEVAADPSFGRKMLQRDGRILDLPPDSSHGRLAFVTAEQALALHRQHGLVLIGRPGSTAARFRFALGDDAQGVTEAVLAQLAAASPAGRG